MINIADKIRELREQAGLSPKELADRSELSPAYISKLENGEYKSLSLTTSKQLADGLSLSLRGFLEEIDFLTSNQNRPSFKLVSQALRKIGYTEKQAREVENYAKYIKLDRSGD
ncbi:MAG: helix-turn-helix domain-containing protein [bacterium]